MNERRLVIICSLLLAGVYVTGYFFPGSLSWGFHFLAFLPAWYTLLYTICVTAILVYAVKGNPDRFIASAAKYLEPRPILFLFSLVIFIISCGVLLRIHIPLLGDGFYLVRNYVEAFHGTAPLYPRDEPLATYYFSAILNIVGISSFQQFLNAFLTADLLLAAGFIINVFMIVRAMFEDVVARLLALCFILVFPYMQLFFGYVETYAAVLFVLSLYVNFSVMYLRRKASFWLVPASYLLTCLTHYLALMQLPSLLFLTYRAWRERRVKQILGGYAVAVVILIMLLVRVNFEIEKFSSWVPYSHFLSIAKSGNPIEQSSQAYAVFSPYHFVDLFNLLFLLCPTAVILLMVAFFHRDRTTFRHDVVTFLASGFVPIGALLCVIKFDLGAARDWDVFAPYTFLLVVTAAFVYFQNPSSVAIRIAVVIISITAMNSLVYISLNATREPAIQRYKTFFDRRTLSQNGFYNAMLFLSQYYHIAKNQEEPITLWHQYINEFPGDPRGYQNVINNYKQRGDNAASAIMQTYEQWLQNIPVDTAVRKEYADFCLDKGNQSYSQGKLDAAALFYQKLIELDSGNAKAYNNLGSVFAQQGKYDSAARLLEKAIALDSAYVEPYYNLANVFIDRGGKPEGIKLLKRAAQLGSIQAQQDLRKQGIEWE